jgi:hypothetical protein
MSVPASEGVHRVNWDLRHPLDLSDDAWERWDHPELPRPVGDRGPWVSPGTYTLTLEARGAGSTRAVEVRGDPELPITAEQYRTRERFMLGLLELEDAFSDLMEDRGMRSGRFGGEAPGSDEARLREAYRTVTGIYGDLNGGGGVRSGSLHPPTTAMLERVEAARAVLEELGG